MIFYNQNVNLVNDNVYTKSIRSQDIKQTQILKSSKREAYIAYMRRMTLYCPNDDLTTAKLYTKFN